MPQLHHAELPPGGDSQATTLLQTHMGSGSQYWGHTVLALAGRPEINQEAPSLVFLNTKGILFGEVGERKPKSTRQQLFPHPKLKPMASTELYGQEQV